MVTIYTHPVITWTNDTVGNLNTFNQEIKEKMTDIDTAYTAEIAARIAAIQGVIDSMKEKRIAQFTASGNWTVPTGVIYAIANLRGAGGGNGTTTGGDGGDSTIAFTAGTIVAKGGKGTTLNPATAGIAAEANSGLGAYQMFATASTQYEVTASTGLAGAEIVAGGVVTPAQVIAVVVGAGGAAGTSGAAGGSGYVWIEYWEPAA